jgi:hypothetical protein
MATPTVPLFGVNALRRGLAKLGINCWSDTPNITGVGVYADTASPSSQTSLWAAVKDLRTRVDTLEE